MMNEAIQEGAVDYILKYQVEPEDLATKIQTLTTGAQNAPTQQG